MQQAPCLRKHVPTVHAYKTGPACLRSRFHVVEWMGMGPLVLLRWGDGETHDCAVAGKLREGGRL